jgi:hypothetical protein
MKAARAGGNEDGRRQGDDGGRSAWQVAKRDRRVACATRVRAIGGFSAFEGVGIEAHKIKIRNLERPTLGLAKAEMGSAERGANPLPV